jgi:hypothetical protein
MSPSMGCGPNQGIFLKKKVLGSKGTAKDFS